MAIAAGRLRIQDANTGPTFLLPGTPKKTDVLVLLADTEKIYNVDSAVQMVILSSSTPFFAKVNHSGTLTLPVADDVTGEAPDYCPVGYGNLPQGATIKFRAPTTCTIVVSCFSAP